MDKRLYRGFIVCRGKHVRRKSTIASYDKSESSVEQIFIKNKSEEALSGNTTKDAIKKFADEALDPKSLTASYGPKRHERRSKFDFLRKICNLKQTNSDAIIDQEEYEIIEEKRSTTSLSKIVKKEQENETTREGQDALDQPDVLENKSTSMAEETKPLEPEIFLTDAVPCKQCADKIDKIDEVDNKLDIIIFGATGTLGSYTVLHAVEMLSKYKWGIAGRNRSKLREVLRNVSTMAKKKLNGTSMFIVDATDKKSLEAMTEECHVVINCCGPYDPHAKTIIEACIRSGTNYVDACVEPALLEKLYTRFNEDAARKHVYVITSCGFMSFATDVGNNYVDSHFKGVVSTIEAYTQFYRLDSQKCVPFMSCAAFQGLTETFASGKEILNLKLDYLCLTQLSKLSYYGVPLTTTDAVEGVSIPMPLINPQVVQRSQEYLQDVEEKPTVQYKNFLTFPSYLYAAVALIWCVFLFVLTQAPGTRDLVLRYPKIFSFGMCSCNCMRKDSLDQFIFAVTLKASGTADDDQQQSKASHSIGNDPGCNANCCNEVPSSKEINKILKVKMCGANPFYGYGCVALLASASTILRETKSLPKQGGVYTPGAAFRNTNILQEVASHNTRYRYRII